MISAERSGGVRLAIAIALAIIVWYGVVASAGSLWDRDEPRFARATVEMMQSGNWLVPTFNGEPRLHKPILIYWLMSVPIRLFGQTELGARGVAPLAAGIVCFLTFLIGRRLFGPRRAILAALILASTPLLLVSGSAATTDALLLAWITGAFAILITAPPGSLSFRQVALLGIVFGGALLTKGPVGLAVVVLGAAGAWWLDRSAILSNRRDWGGLAVAVLIGVVLLLLWGLPANRATGGELASRGLGYHVLQRSVQPLESHGGDFFLFLPYYLVIIALAFFPWTLYLPDALRRLRRRRETDSRSHAVLLGWIIPTLILMTLVATKLPHYVLPVWPALALVVAGSLDFEGKDAIAPGRAGRILFGIGGGLLSATFLVGAWFLQVHGLAAELFGLGILTTAMTLFGLRSEPEQLERTVRLLLVGAFLMQAMLAFFIVPAAEEMKLTPPIVQAVNTLTSPDVPVAAVGYTEPSLVYYLDRGRVEMLKGGEDVVQWSRRNKQGVLIATEKELRKAEEMTPDLGLTNLSEIEGVNLVHGDSSRVFVLGRHIGGAREGESPNRS